MITSLVSRLKFRTLNLSVLTLLFMLTARPVSAKESLLGIPYTMPGQEATIMLYTATQPEKPRGKDLVLLSMSAGTGFGIYAYVFRLQKVLSESMATPIPTKTIMLGISEEAATVKRIFNFPSGPDDILILEDEGEESTEDIEVKDFSSLPRVPEAQKWLLGSRLTVGLVNDELETLIATKDLYKVPYAFFNTLHHSENLDDAAALEVEYQQLTATLLSTEILDLETSFRSLHAGYIEAMREYGNSLNDKFFPAGYPIQSNLSREFGLRKYKIGLLLNQPDSPESHLDNLSRLSADELFALTGTTELKKALPFFLSGEYYFSYMHTLFANLQFIQTISLAANKRKLTLLMKMTASDFEDPVVIDALRKVNITDVKFWSAKSGQQEFDLRESPQDKHQFQISVLNLFPTPEPLTNALAHFSKPVVGTTGELSLFTVLSMGKLPLHEWMILQRYLNGEFAKIADEHSLKSLNDFFRFFSPEKKANALKQVLKEPSSIKTFTEVLTAKYNASPFLKKLVEMTFVDDSPLWKAVADIDEAIEQSVVHTLPYKLQDIAWARMIARRIQDLGSEPDKEELEKAYEEIQSYAENIKTSLLREMLSEIPDNLSLVYEEE